MLLPELAPRIKGLGLNVKWLAYLMALVFTATRILPRGHHYASPKSYGSYGISDILFEARRHLKGGVHNLDQYVIYGSFLLGMILLAGQFILLFFILISHSAEAASQSIPWRGMFNTPNPTNDLAMMMLDRVFEIPGMFGSKFAPTNINQITGFGQGLHHIFGFYNYGMLFIAGLIVVYYIFALIVETVQSGKPFGERFAKVYVPIRIMLALAFLLPLGYGFSAGQLLTFQLAKWGSAFATNGWLLLNQKAASNPLGLGADQLVVMPKTPETEDLIRFYALVHACRGVYMEQYGKDIMPYLVNHTNPGSSARLATSMNYDAALQVFPKSNIRITFGELNDRYTNPGHVKPYCGELNIPVSDKDVRGAALIRKAYWDYLRILWNDTSLQNYGDRMAKNHLGKSVPSGGNIAGWSDPKSDPESGFYANVRAESQSRFASLMNSALNEIRNLPESQLPTDSRMLLYGWGGAGIWFNTIAEYNGAMMSASFASPNPASYPAVLQQTILRKAASDNDLRNLTKFMPDFSNGAALTEMMSGAKLDDTAKDAEIATFLNRIYVSLNEDDSFGDGSEAPPTNPVAGFVNMIFGTEGLFELRGNQHIHPLAKMSALGRSIIDRAVTYMGGAIIMGGLSGLSSVVDNQLGLKDGVGAGAFFGGIGKMFSAFALVGVTVGVVLFYVIPFLPFLYFFFAVGRWVKSIFEALVGIPLWALAHLRIDGDGIPGPAAANGYFLLFEIMLRPILVLFGMMAAVSCFSALAITLDTLFDLVIKNAAGYTPLEETAEYGLAGHSFKRGHVDQFFYTVVYAVLLYMMALSCFKLIDLIPNSVLRFLGTSVNEFADKMNLEQDIIRTAGLSSYMIVREAGDAAVEGGQTIGQGIAAPIDIAMTGMRKAGQQAQPPSQPPQGG